MPAQMREDRVRNEFRGRSERGAAHSPISDLYSFEDSSAFTSAGLESRTLKNQPPS